MLHSVLVRLMHKQSFKGDTTKPSKDLGGFVVFDNLDRYRRTVIKSLVSIAIVGNLFVDHLGVMDLTSKSIFINKDTNKRCESKA